MSSIAKAIGPLVNIALLLLFAIIIFAIVGLEFYSGALNKTCYDIRNLSKLKQAVLILSWPLNSRQYFNGGGGRSALCHWNRGFSSYWQLCLHVSKENVAIWLFWLFWLLRRETMIVCKQATALITQAHWVPAAQTGSSGDTATQLYCNYVKYHYSRYNESICLEKWDGPNKGNICKDPS